MNGPLIGWSICSIAQVNFQRQFREENEVSANAADGYLGDYLPHKANCRCEDCSLERAQERIAALERLCQQQHEVLESLCDDIELGGGCDGNGDVFDLAVAENAFKAYAAVFPKTGGAK